MRVVIVSNTTWYIYNFRLNFIKELISIGSEVYIVSPYDKYVDKLLILGVKHKNIKLSRFKKNFFKDFYFTFRLFFLNLIIKPNIIHNFTIKPVIYGSIACWLLPKIKVINSIPGLGILFLNNKKNRFNNFFIKKLYKIAILQRYKTIFQNSDDMKFFIKNKILKKEQCFLIKGSGVDLNRFNRKFIKKDSKHIYFGIMARMLWSKGVKEFIESAKIVFKKNPKTRFIILGSPDLGGPDSIPLEWLKEINKQKHIIWKPHQDDVINFLNKIDIFVLPTFYPEGLPKSLLEAAAMSLPLIATDTPGCREIVKDGINGFLVEIKNTVDLESKMYKLSINAHLRETMGLESRKIVENEYDDKTVNSKTFSIYKI